MKLAVATCDSRPGVVRSHLGGAEDTIALDSDDCQSRRHLHPEVVRLRGSHGWVECERLPHLRDVLHDQLYLRTVTFDERTDVHVESAESWVVRLENG